MAGRTNDVSGSMVIADGTATRTSFTVSVAGVATSKSERNVMDVTKYPAATFVLTLSDRTRHCPRGQRKD